RSSEFGTCLAFGRAVQERWLNGLNSVSCEAKLKLECTFELDDTRRAVSAETRTEDACWRAGGIRDDAKTGPVGEVGVWIQKIRMIKDVVCLHSNLKQAGFQAGYLETLNHCQVG